MIAIYKVYKNYKNLIDLKDLGKPIYKIIIKMYKKF